MVEQKRGAIVNIGSVAPEHVPSQGWMAYNMTKAVLECFTRCLAAELGPKGIRVNSVSPGMTTTDLIANVSERVQALVAAHTPMRRLGRPEDVASAVAFLLGDGAAHITGQNLRVCGGAGMG